MMKLTKRKREELRKTYEGCCAFCGMELPEQGWSAEHIGEKYVKGGLVTVCTECRTSKGNLSPERYRVALTEQLERAQRHSSNLRQALRFGLVIAVKKPVKFWFECISEEQPTPSKLMKDNIQPLFRTRHLSLRAKRETHE
ncbi:HNH endonuclease (plasmid) [Pantoea allii]|uniref:HNH endonuclease n=1 Tax=Pantoea allii TaxID=574096 RepID=UPI0039777350